LNFAQIAEGLDHIRRASSTLEKKRLLRVYAETPGFKDVVKFIFDPNFTTGLKDRKLEGAGFSSVTYSPVEMMNYLRNNNTGSDVAASIANSFILQYADNNVLAWLAKGLVTKDLQIGVSVTTLNNVFGKNFIPKIGIMRGQLCYPEFSGAFIATEKIDGNRRIILQKGDSIEVYTRSGKRDYGLVDIETQARLLPPGYMYDAECVAIGDFEHSLDLRQATASILNSKGPRRGVKALIFDMVPIDEYFEGQSKWGAMFRKLALCTLFGDYRGWQLLGELMSEAAFKHVVDTIDNRPDLPLALPNIQSLPILGIVHNYEEAIQYATPIWDTNGEGIMLVEHKSPYIVSATPKASWLKVKRVNEYTLRCCDVLEGSNKYEGMLGAIEVEYQRPGDPAAYYVRVGSGFTDYERELYWQQPELIINKMIDIESFGESKNADGGYSLNCPVFKRIAGDD
jgi:DNA ligase-1